MGELGTAVAGGVALVATGGAALSAIGSAVGSSAIAGAGAAVSGTLATAGTTLAGSAAIKDLADTGSKAKAAIDTASDAYAKERELRAQLAGEASSPKPPAPPAAPITRAPGVTPGSSSGAVNTSDFQSALDKKSQTSPLYIAALAAGLLLK